MPNSDRNILWAPLTVLTRLTSSNTGQRLKNSQGPCTLWELGFFRVGSKRFLEMVLLPPVANLASLLVFSRQSSPSHSKFRKTRVVTGTLTSWSTMICLLETLGATCTIPLRPTPTERLAKLARNGNKRSGLVHTLIGVQSRSSSPMVIIMNREVLCFWFLALTLFFLPETGGLQVRMPARYEGQPDEERWVDVPYVEDAFVINLGDLIQYWTHGQLVSTMHRVCPSPIPEKANSRRFSCAYFLRPGFDTSLEPIPSPKLGVDASLKSTDTMAPTVKPLTAGEWLHARALKSFTNGAAPSGLPAGY